MRRRKHDDLVMKAQVQFYTLDNVTISAFLLNSQNSFNNTRLNNTKIIDTAGRHTIQNVAKITR